MTATQTDGDPLIYTIEQPEPIGVGSDGNFYVVPPPILTPGVSIDANGSISITNPVMVRLAFQSAGKYTFTVTADDGSSGIDLDTRQFTIYDSWEWWANQTQGLLTAWSDAYGNMLVLTEGRTREAIEDLNAFLGGLDHLPEVTGGLSSVVWAAAANHPVAGTVATIAATAVGDAIHEFNEGNVNSLTAGLENAIEEVTGNSLDMRTDVYTAKWNELNDKRDVWNDPGGSPASKAVAAREYFTNLVIEFDFDPFGLVGSVSDEDVIPAPLSTDIYGGMLVNWTNNQGIHLNWNSTNGWYSGDPPDGGIDGQEVANELNAIGYVPPDEG